MEAPQADEYRGQPAVGLRDPREEHQPALAARRCVRCPCGRPANVAPVPPALRPLREADDERPLDPRRPVGGLGGPRSVLRGHQLPARELAKVHQVAGVSDVPDVHHHGHDVDRKVPQQLPEGARHGGEGAGAPRGGGWRGVGWRLRPAPVLPVEALRRDAGRSLVPRSVWRGAWPDRGPEPRGAARFPRRPGLSVAGGSGCRSAPSAPQSTRPWRSARA